MLAYNFVKLEKDANRQKHHKKWKTLSSKLSKLFK